MNLDALYSTIDILKYLGAICNDPTILDDNKNRLNPLKDLIHLLMLKFTCM